MNGWMKTIIGYLLLVNIAMQMIPNKKYEQYVRLFTGFLLMVLMLQPVLKIRSADDFLEKQITALVQEQEAVEVQIKKECEQFQEESWQGEAAVSESVENVTIEPVEVLGND